MKFLSSYQKREREKKKKNIYIYIYIWEREREKGGERQEDEPYWCRAASPELGSSGSTAQDPVDPVDHCRKILLQWLTLGRLKVRMGMRLKKHNSVPNWMGIGWAINQSESSRQWKRVTNRKEGTWRDGGSVCVCVLEGSKPRQKEGDSSFSPIPRNLKMTNLGRTAFRSGEETRDI